MKICGRKRCGTCPYLERGKEFFFSPTLNTLKCGCFHQNRKYYHREVSLNLHPLCCLGHFPGAKPEKMKVEKLSVLGQNWKVKLNAAAYVLPRYRTNKIKKITDCQKKTKKTHLLCRRHSWSIKFVGSRGSAENTKSRSSLDIQVIRYRGLVASVRLYTLRKAGLVISSSDEDENMCARSHVSALEPKNRDWIVSV